MTKTTYTLDNSPYAVIVNNIKYMFSSEINRNKFTKRVNDKVSDINHSLSLRWGFSVYLNDLGVLICYLSIEHRGCRIILPDGGEITQWEEISFVDGRIQKNV